MGNLEGLESGLERGSSIGLPFQLAYQLIFFSNRALVRKCPLWGIDIAQYETLDGN